MRNKNIVVVNALLEVVAGTLLIGSFFLLDKKKAVKMRWIGVGILATSVGIRIATAPKKVYVSNEYELQLWKNDKLHDTMIVDSKAGADMVEADYKKLGYTIKINKL